MPIKADTLSFHSAAVNCQHSCEDIAFTSINGPADAAALKGHEDTHPRGTHTLNDAKISHNMHAYEPDDANKPEGTTNQATYHLPGCVPGAPLWEQPGIVDESSVVPSSANSSSR